MCGTASGWAKMALVCLVVGMALHIAGWATINWMVNENSTNTTKVGLWEQERCSKGNCDKSAVSSSFETDDFNGVRALETIVFCVVVFTVVLMAIYVFFEGVRRQPVAIVLMILCFVTGVVSLISMIIWLVTIPSPFVVSFSLGLTVLAFLLMFIAGTLMMPDVFEPTDHYMKGDSDLGTPYTPPGRRGVITPIAYKGGGHYNGGGYLNSSYRW